MALMKTWKFKKIDLSQLKMMKYQIGLLSMKKYHQVNF